MAHVFVTGMPRSGTTLVDKLLSLHPDAYVASQPLPLLYVDIKRAFLERRRDSSLDAPHARRYPLNDMFAANAYPAAELLDFLATAPLSHDQCRAALEEMIPFDGQYTKPAAPLEVLSGYRPAPLFEFVERYLQFLLANEAPPLIGSKETYCEEYVPYFLQRGAWVLNILRDPRDVITSLNHGRGTSFGGRPKPHLFNLRQWRKSVTFALAHRDNPRFLAVRYEDLVTDPVHCTRSITDFLGLSPLSAEVIEGDLRGQSGELWRSNSSHRSATRITATSVGAYRRHLTPEEDSFAQAICLPELRRCGYETAIDAHEVLPIFDRYRECESPARTDLAYYAWSRERRLEEVERWRCLQSATFDPDLFAFESSFAQLCAQ